MGLDGNIQDQLHFRVTSMCRYHILFIHLFLSSIWSLQKLPRIDMNILDFSWKIEVHLVKSHAMITWLNNHIKNASLNTNYFFTPGIYPDSHTSLHKGHRYFQITNHLKRIALPRIKFHSMGSNCFMKRMIVQWK